MYASTTSMSPSQNGYHRSRAPVVTVPHLSFATDLLFNLDEVRTGCNNGLATQSSLVTLLKNRIALERHYASELSRITKQSHLEELEYGTMCEALGKLKAQYLNTSVQHRVLADNLEEDVLRPIEALYTYNYGKAQNLAKLVNNIKKQAKVHEDVYKKDYMAFDKGFRDATTHFATAMDAGFSSTMIEHQYHVQLAEMDMGWDESDRMQSMMATSFTGGTGGSGGSGGSPPMGGRPRQKSTAATIQTINNNSQKLVNWLLASDQQRKENVYIKAVQVLEGAEVSRRKCLQSWESVEQSRLDMYRALQSVLTEYQQMAEHRISNLATNLRKHVVFESSTLANEQYDWQMIASKIENVDFEGDIREFIMDHFSHDLETMTVNDLCHTAATSSLVFSPNSKPCRPLKKVPLEISDLAMRRIPYDYDGNREPLRSVLVTRSMPALPSARPQAAATETIKEMQASGAQIQTTSPRHLSIQIPSPSPPKSSSDQEAIGHYRVCLAQDVARAIARAYELRSVRKHSLQIHQSPFCDSESESENESEMNHLRHAEPENNGAHLQPRKSARNMDATKSTIPADNSSARDLLDHAESEAESDSNESMPQTNDEDGGSIATTNARGRESTKHHSVESFDEPSDQTDWPIDNTSVTL